MSNLESAISEAGLMMPAPIYPDVPNPKRPRSKMQVAKRVFQLAASGGFPYTGMTFQQWGKKWLSSDTFRLMEIDINAAASPHLPKNPERVAFRVLCAQDSVDPIVVDLNRQKVGKSHMGFIPEVIVVDGKHRKKGQELQGHTRILAWVGCKAEKKLKNATIVDALHFKSVSALRAVMHAGEAPAVEAEKLRYSEHKNLNLKPTPLDSAINLHCATGGQLIAKKPKMKSNAGGMGGSLGGGSGNNPERVGLNASARIVEECEACSPANSEGQFDGSSNDPSAKLGYDFPKPNIKAPGAKGWSGLISSPAKQSPGSGVGPRVGRSTGAKNSEMTRHADSIQSEGMKAKSRVIDEIHVKDKSKKHLFANLDKRG